MSTYYETPDRTIGDASAYEEAFDSVAHAARNNTMPLVLAGLGVAGFLLVRAVRPTMRDRYWYDTREAGDRPGENQYGSTGRTLKSRAAGIVEDVSGAADTLLDKTGDFASDIAESVSDVSDTLRDTASSYADSAYRNSVAGYKVTRNRAAHYARQAPRQGTRIAVDSGTWVRDNPVPAGLVALALGAAAASFLSYRRYSDDAFEPRDDFPRSPDPEGTPRDTLVQQKPRKRASTKTSMEVATGGKGKRAKAPKAVKTAKPKGKSKIKPSSPDLAAAIPTGTSKLGKNVVASTSVLGVGDDERKS